jgi:hypothetical protein
LRFRHYSHSTQSDTSHLPTVPLQPQRLFHRRSSQALQAVKFLVFDYYDTTFQSLRDFPNRLPQWLMKFICDNQYSGYMIVVNQYRAKLKKNPPQSCAGLMLLDMVTLDDLNNVDLSQFGAVRVAQLIKLMDSLSLKYPAKKITIEYLESSTTLLDAVNRISASALAQRVALKIIQYNEFGVSKVAKKIGYPKRKHHRECPPVSAESAPLPGSPDIQSTPTVVAEYPTSESSLCKRDSAESQPEAMLAVEELSEPKKSCFGCVIS